jgi:predicted MPP superfamily phosphohydrolase
MKILKLLKSRLNIPNKYKLLSLLVVLILAFLWLWFSETRNIQIHEDIINTGFTSKFVLISDLHLGLFKNQEYLTEVVNKINAQNNIEFVVIAGDFIYNDLPVKDQKYYDDLFEPIKDIKYPVVVTFGNHDNGSSDPDITDMLTITLEKYGARVIEDKEISIDGLNIVGLYDYWEKPEGYKFLDTVNTPINIVVTHNPDIVDLYDKPVGLTLSGHTHCGQVRVPLLNLSFPMPINSGYQNGLYNSSNGKVFVTCGLSETGFFPFRLWNRPTIDVIETN